MMELHQPGFWAAVGEIILINILLSGDNAVVIALACHTLPARQRKWGIILGATPAAVLLIGFAVVIAYLMTIPYLRLVGGAILLWIAIDLLREEEEAKAHLRQCTSLWTAVRIIVVADVIMSLDNVLAVAAVAKGSMPLLVIGLAISVPLVIFGSAVLLKVMDRFPMLVIAGGMLIGYVAGDVAVGDPAVGRWIGAFADTAEIVVPLACAALVLPVAHLVTRWAARRRKAEGRI
jgi:YjbE family integral membrane protein